MNIINLTGRRVRIYDNNTKNKKVVATIEPGNGRATVTVKQEEVGSISTGPNLVAGRNEGSTGVDDRPSNGPNVCTEEPGHRGDIPVARTLVEVQGLPSPKFDTVYLVPFEVIQIERDRCDVLAVNATLGGSVRGSDGRVIGYTSLQYYG